jgi:hypothetical protein
VVHPCGICFSEKRVEQLSWSSRAPDTLVSDNGCETGFPERVAGSVPIQGKFPGTPYQEVGLLALGHGGLKSGYTTSVNAKFNNA